MDEDDEAEDPEEDEKDGCKLSWNGIRLTGCDWGCSFSIKFELLTAAVIDSWVGGVFEPDTLLTNFPDLNFVDSLEFAQF